MKKAESRAHTEPNGSRSVHVSLASQALRNEHKRAVRVVEEKNVRRHKRFQELESGFYDYTGWLAGYEQACADLLVALRKGR